MKWIHTLFIPWIVLISLGRMHADNPHQLEIKKMKIPLTYPETFRQRIIYHILPIAITQGFLWQTFFDKKGFHVGLASDVMIPALANAMYLKRQGLFFDSKAQKRFASIVIIQAACHCIGSRLAKSFKAHINKNYPDAQTIAVSHK